jgi:hypothetical protein
MRRCRMAVLTQRPLVDNRRDTFGSQPPPAWLLEVSPCLSTWTFVRRPRPPAKHNGSPFHVCGGVMNSRPQLAGGCLRCPSHESEGSPPTTVMSCWAGPQWLRPTPNTQKVPGPHMIWSAPKSRSF